MYITTPPARRGNLVSQLSLSLFPVHHEKKKSPSSNAKVAARRGNLVSYLSLSPLCPPYIEKKKSPPPPSNAKVAVALRSPLARHKPLSARSSSSFSPPSVRDGSPPVYTAYARLWGY